MRQGREMKIVWPRIRAWNGGDKEPRDVARIAYHMVGGRGDADKRNRGARRESVTRLFMRLQFSFERRRKRANGNNRTATTRSAPQSATMHRLQRLPAICALILSLSRRLESRTVSPDPYHAAAATAAAYAADYGAGSAAYYGGARLGGYGHRTVPADAARKIRDNEERPYETAGTYEYMTRPTGKKSSRTRVPDTEKRPPGADDVELIYDANGKNDDRSRDYGESRTSDRKTFPDRYGYVRGAGPRYVDRPVAKQRYVGSDGEWIAAGPEAARSSSSSSSSGKNAQKTRKKNGGGGGGGHAEQREEADVTVDEPGQQKIVKKNEYSKKREFFDEEHVKNPVRVAEAEASAAASSSPAARDRVRKGQQKNRAGEPRKKRKRRAKKVKKNKKRVAGHNFGGSGSGSDNYAAVSSGYGQILAVR